MIKNDLFSNYWFHLVLNSILFIIIAIGLDIRFEENDDVAMCLIADGGYSCSPDCHLVFINAIFGLFLVGLYSIVRSIEWYMISFAILHIVSMSVITYALATDNKKSFYIKALWFLFAYLLWIRILLSLQFTTTAAISTLAGCILMLRNQNAKLCIMGGGLIFVGSLIRFEASALVVLLLIPFMVLRLRTNWKSYIPFIIVGIIVIAAFFADSLFYQQNDWKYYRAYNAVRGSINDANNANDTYVYENLPEGIDADDYSLLLFYSPDPEVMTLDVLRQIRLNIADVPMVEKMRNLLFLSRYIFILLLILLIIFSIRALPNDKSPRMFFMFGYFVYICSIICYLGILYEFKQRVFFIILMSMLTVLYSMLETYNKKWGTVLLSICMMLMFGKYAKQLYGQIQLDKRLRHEWVDLQHPIMSGIPSDCYVMSFGSQMYMELQSPWHIKDLYPHHYGRGWMTAIPFNRQIAWSSRDLLRENIYIFTVKDNLSIELINMLQNSIKEHYKISTSVSICAENEKYQLIQLKSL